MLHLNFIKQGDTRDKRILHIEISSMTVDCQLYEIKEPNTDFLGGFQPNFFSKANSSALYIFATIW